MQVLVCEMMIYWCDLYKKSLLYFLGIGVLQIRRPEGVRRNALRVWRSQLTFGFEIIVPLRLRKGKAVGETKPTDTKRKVPTLRNQRKHRTK